MLREGSLGLGKAIWTAGGNANGWTLFASVLRAGLEKQLPVILKTPCVSPLPVSLTCKVKACWIVGKEHYDLGNDLFSRMLDPFMQYSCAYWKEASTLEEAQQAKLRLISEIAVAARYARAGYWLRLGRAGVFYGEALRRQRGRRHHFR